MRWRGRQGEGEGEGEGLESDTRLMCPMRGNDMVRGRSTGLVWSADVILVRGESRGFPSVDILTPPSLLSPLKERNSLERCFNWLYPRSNLSMATRSVRPRGRSPSRLCWRRRWRSFVSFPTSSLRFWSWL